MLLSEVFVVWEFVLSNECWVWVWQVCLICFVYLDPLFTHTLNQTNLSYHQLLYWHNNWHKDIYEWRNAWHNNDWLMFGHRSTSFMMTIRSVSIGAYNLLSFEKWCEYPNTYFFVFFHSTLIRFPRQTERVGVNIFVTQYQ